MSILVTGGAGYIGSHVVRYFLEEEKEHVVVFDNLSRGYREALETLSEMGELDFVEGDLVDIDALHNIFDTFNITAVFHLAALCNIDESVRDPGLYYYNNVLGSLNLLEAMKAADVSNLVFSSTCAVYGNNVKSPVNESAPIDPGSPYAESKYLAERLIARYAESGDIRHVILRYFNVCGAAEDGLIGDSKKPSLLLVQNAVRGALDIEDFSLTCSPVDTPDGTPIRDFIDVEDVAYAHFAAKRYLEEGGVNTTLNIGSGDGVSVQQVIHQVSQVMGVEFPVGMSEPRQGEIPAIYADISLALDQLEFGPSKTLGESIRSLATWYESHPDGWEG